LVKILSKGILLVLGDLEKGRREKCPSRRRHGRGERGGEGEVRERGAGSGVGGGVFLTLFYLATVRGDAQAPASPPWVATHMRCGACRVDVAATAAPLAVATHRHLLRRWEWRRQKGLFA
jgi:hypothetical protein